MSTVIASLFLFIITAAAYVGLLVYILRLDELIGVERWMAGFCLWSVLLAGTLALGASNLPMLNISPGLWLAVASVGSLCLFGATTFGYLELPKPWAWAVAAPVVMAIILVGDARDPAAGLAEMTWRAALAQPGTWFPFTVAAVWVLAGVALLSLTYLSVTQASLPLLANRRFWWAIALSAIFSSEAIAMWASGPLAVIAQVLRVAGVAAAVYAATTLELMDIRGVIRMVIGNALFIAFLSFVILVGISASIFLLDRLPNGQKQLAVTGVVIALAVVYQQVQPRLRSAVSRAVLAAGYDTAEIAKGYSQRIANLLDVGDLAVTLGITLAQAVQSSRLGLLLITPKDKFARVDVMIGAGKFPTYHHYFGKDSLFLQTLINSRRPLSQYSLDYDPKYKSLSADDREWLRGLGADIHVPVFDGDTLSAVLAVGARQNREPYRQGELELLQSIADQTSVALKNARLVTNLRVLNEGMRDLYENTRVLNKELGASNERLRQMDKVKTDFINIASHELRTPLTKLRGYSDLLNEMNSVGDLDRENIDVITHQLSKACTRLEELLSQMLDVSQLDIEALQLVVGPTTIDKVARIAAESLRQAVRERKQILTIQDMQHLPLIRGDFQRLVQTFRQLIGNAIKFTPDGGRVEVYAYYLPPNEERDRPEAIEIVVADTGVGIDPEHYELIFEKFYRVGSVDLHSTGDTKFMGAGPGLGLTIARGVIKGHGGQIWVESDGFDPKMCPGSQFHIILPIQPKPVPVQPMPVSA